MDEAAWYAANSGGRLQVVGTKRPNAWGFHDMAGNVYEFCCDFFDHTYIRQAPEVDPVNLQQSMHCAIRGCALFDQTGKEGIELYSFRGCFGTMERGGGIGFRVCLGPVVDGLRRAVSPPSWERLVIPHTGDWALDFDGHNNHATVPTMTWSKLEPLTIETVFVWNGGEVFLAGRTGPDGFWLEIRDNALWACTDERSVGTAMSFSKYTRLHAAAVRNGGDVRLYVNGMLVKEDERIPGQDQPAATDTGEFRIGGSEVASRKGMIETLRVTKGARYAANFDLEQVLPLKPDPRTLCLLDFEEGSGELARDSSGNNHHGRIHEAPWISVWPCPVPETELRRVKDALLQANPDLAELAMRVSGLPDAVSLDLSGNPGLKTIEPLRGLPLGCLRLDDCSVEDLTPLHGMPLKNLAISRTLVADLSPLRGLPLVTLIISTTKVTDLSPLSGSPLAVLFAVGAPFGDLSPIADCPLRILMATSCQVGTLPRFSAGTLQLLSITGNPVTDLSPLAGLPLVQVSIAKTGISDLSPLLSCPKLNWLGISDPLVAETVSAQFPRVETVVANPTWQDFTTPAYYRISKEVWDMVRRR